MAITRPFAYNTGSEIPGTTQLGNLAIGVDDLDYSLQPGGVRWWNGPDESLGYIIAHETPSGNQPNPLGVESFLGFWRSEFTDESFIGLSEYVSQVHGSPQTFLSGSDAKTWLNNNGYWTSWSESPLPTPTNTPTPTLSSLPVTPTPTSSTLPVTPTPTTSPDVTTTTTTLPVSGFTINFSEVGPNVVMSASGTLNINDLTFVNSSNFVGPGGLGISTATFVMGGSGDFSAYSGFTTTPTNFGTGSGAGASSGSGNVFGVIIDSTPPYQLLVPSGYTTGDNISSTQTFNNQSFSSMGLVPGTYTYTWGSGANADAINVVIGGTPPVTTTTTTTSGGTGEWNFYYTTEGDLTVGPPVSSGNTIFLYQGSPNQQTFGPNYTGGTFSLLFNVNDSNGNNYLSQFLDLDNNGGTITITQNGNTASYSGLNLDYNMGPSNQWVELRVINNSQVVQQSPISFVYGQPITLTIS